MKLFRNEKVIHRNIPEKYESPRQIKYQLQEMWKSIPEILMIGLAIFLVIKGAFILLVTLIAVGTGALGIWGRLRGVRKK